MSINKHIINHEIKLMEMGGREEILLKKETTISIVLKLSSCKHSHKPDLSISGVD
jgi:hypothetical protein